MKHNVSVYHRSGSDGEVARGDCVCGWTTGLQHDSFAWVKREAARHERRTAPHGKARTQSSDDIIAAAKRGDVIALTGPGSLLEALTREVSA